MEQFLGVIFNNFPFFLLLFLRISGIFMISPVFGRRNIPARAKLGFALLLSYIVFMVIPQGNNAYIPLNIYDYALKCIKEILFGFTIGFINALFFSAVLTAGELMDNQIGFGMAKIFDPYANVQMPLTGNFLNILLILLFFAVDGHHGIIRLIVAVFTQVPPGKITVSSSLGLIIIEFFVTTFLIGIKIAIPIVAASLIAESALAIIMRAVPQMNVFVIGMPLKVVLGMIILLIMLPAYQYFITGVFDDMNKAFIKTVQGFT